jgi:hypothetical protein
MARRRRSRPLNWARSFAGGAQADYNIQLGSAVVAIEADVQWLNAYDNFAVVSTNPLQPRSRLRCIEK